MKAILLDIDGVLLHHDTWYIEDFCKDYDENALNLMIAYCDSAENKMCDKGFLDPYEVIRPYLERIGYPGTIENFFRDKNNKEKCGIDWEALGKIAKLSEKGKNCFIGSNQDFRRKSFLVEEMNIEIIFKDAYFSCDFGYAKPQREFWEISHNKMKTYIGNLEKNEVLFLDDRKENIDSAREYGFSVVHIKEKNDLHQVLDGILS